MAVASTSAAASDSKEKGQASNPPEEQHAPSQSVAIVEDKQKPKKRKNPGVRLIGGRIYDSENGKSCHQCRQKTMDVMASCKNQKKNKQCTIQYCHKCLLNRYGEKAEEVSVLEDWFCPKCKGNCNCSFCMKKRGQQPTGILVHTAKSIGFSSVSEMLLVRGSDNQSGKESPLSMQKKQGKNILSEDTDMDLDEQKGKKVKEENVQDGSNGMSGLKDKAYDREGLSLSKGSCNKKDRVIKDVAHEMQNGDLKNGTPKETVPRKPKTLKVEKDSICSLSESIVAEVPFPQGSELRTVLSIELQPEEIGYALQFLEFCTAFGEIIKLRKDAAQHILRDIVSQVPVHRGRSPLTQCLFRLLSLIQMDSGEESPVISDSLSHENSWLFALQKCISGSKYLSEKLKLDQFDGGAASYDSLNSIERLKLVNFVCDEFLCTNIARTWIVEQKLKFSEKEKEAKEKVVAAKQKEKQLKQKMKDEVAQAVIAQHGIPVSILEHEAMISKIKEQVAQVQDEILQSKGMLSKEEQQCMAVRTKPVLLDTEGRTFWRLNCFDDESNILLQDASLPHESEFREIWFTYEEQKEGMEKYLSFRKKK